MQKITPFLWFNTEARAAAEYYVSVFKDGTILSENTLENTPSGTVDTLSIRINGLEMQLMSAGPYMKINSAISFVVMCDTQEEIDYYWEKLSAVPDAEQCGWCTDKFGVTWQVVPRTLVEMQKTGTKEQLARVTEAFLKMKKFDIAALQKAYEG